MRYPILILAAAQCVSVAASSMAEADTEARRLSLAEAEALAIQQNTAVEIAASSIAGARERVAAARASRLPKVMLEGNALLWDQELSFALALPAIPDMPPPDMDADAITVRSRVTASATLTVAQPITPQIALHHLLELERAGLAAATEEKRQTEMEMAYRAADGYFLVLLARAAGDIADLRSNQLTAQIERVKALVEGGVLQPVDVMRLDAALAAATQDSIRSRSQATLAAATLALILGMPAGQNIEVNDSFAAEPGPPPLTMDEAMQLAMDNRPDLEVLAHRSAQAKSGASAAKAQLWPTLVAVGSLQHNEGGGTFQAKNTWYVGLNLQWDLWDWGQRWHGYKEAEAKARQVQLGTEQLANQVRLEVESAIRNATSSYQALAVARTGLKAAEEAFRIQTAQYEEGVATTTDMLTAQTEVTQARVGYATARYTYFRALVALTRATGQLPTAIVTKI